MAEVSELSQKRPGRRRGTFTAIGGSLGFHGLLVIAALWSVRTPSELIRTQGWEGDGDAVSVSLVGPISGVIQPRVAARAQDQLQSDQLESLFRKVRTVDPEQSSTAPSAHSSLDQLLGETQASSRRTPPCVASRPMAG